jgi:ribose-phosphate pyrophosphokinase
VNSTAPLLVALRESGTLGLAVSRAAGIELAPLEDRPFEAGEFKLRPLASVRERTVFAVQSLAESAEASVSQRFLRLLFLLFGLKDAGAARTIAIIPYLAFARKDRRTQARDPVTMRYVAQLLEATGVDRVVTLDVHNPAALENAFRIPVDHLSAIPMFVDHVAGQLGAADIAVASPDVGGVKRAQIFRELLERRLGRIVEFAFIEKRRAGATVSSGRVVGEVAGCEVIVLDDLCASGGTLRRAAVLLRAAGARTVRVAFTHAPLAAGLAALAADSAIEQIMLTDSVGLALQEPSASVGKVHLLPVAPLLGQAVARMTGGVPLTPLLDRWPPEDSA